MREFEFKFAKGLRRGLREEDDNPRNDEALVKCLNTKPTEEGLAPIVPVSYSVDSVVSWPFPQVFEIPLFGSLCSSTTNVGYSGDDPVPIAVSSTANVAITNGLPPFTWAVTGTGLSWLNAVTNTRSNTLVASSGATGDGSWTVTDVCSDEAGGDTAMLVGLTWGDNDGDDYTGKTADALIYEASPDANYGNDTYLGMGAGAPSGRINRSIIKFSVKSDLETLGAAAVVSAIFYGRLETEVIGNHTISAYRVLRDWVESEVTWNSFSTGNAWDEAGCAGSNDRSDSAEASVYFATGTAEGTYSLILDITSLVQKWFAGTAEEYGVLLKSDNEAAGEYVTASDSETAGATRRPYLEISYI